LPYLLVNIKHVDSPMKLRFFALVRRQHIVKPPFYGADAYRSTSILALHALGSQGRTALSELLKVAQDPRTHWWGMMSLLAIGTNAIPTLAKGLPEHQCSGPEQRRPLMIAIDEGHALLGFLGWPKRR